MTGKIRNQGTRQPNSNPKVKSSNDTAPGNGLADPANAAEIPPDHINSLLIERALENLSRLSPRGQRGLLRLLDKWNAADPKRRAVLARIVFDSLDDLSDGDIAEMAEVNRTTLYTWPEYMQAKKSLKRSYTLPRGAIDEDGRIEAWEWEE